LRVALIGMAGIGKSTWAGRLERKGFLRLDCDRMIAGRLSRELAGAGDLIAALGSWMGLPWEAGYEERAAQYQRLEASVMEEILGSLAEGGAGDDVVVDTAGSVIYLADEMLADLAKRCVVVHLAAPPEVRRRLLEAYLVRPGPVLWHGMFLPEPGEALDEAVARCYERLLEDRERRYTRWARVSLPHRLHRRELADADAFLEGLRYRGSGLEF
jgi:shikimate kinase